MIQSIIEQLQGATFYEALIGTGCLLTILGGTIAIAKGKKINPKLYGLINKAIQYLKKSKR